MTLSTTSRDERPPKTSSAGASELGAAKRWVPPSAHRRDAPVLDKNDLVFRRVRGILNKLAPEKFDKLSLELLNVGIDSQVVLKGIILLIFEKALDEPKYSSLYARLCHRLCEDAPNFEPSTSGITTFRRLLLNKCQDEFENRSRATEVFDKDGPLTTEETEQLWLAKYKMLGNIKFIGELGKLQMLHEGILHKCIKQLLEKKKHVAVEEMSEDLECLCQIMKTVGPRLDTDKAKAWMDKYFDRMKFFSLHEDLPSRIRFMLQDVLELRKNKWVPRKNMSENGPSTIQQVREECAKVYGVYYPPPGSNGRGGPLFGGPIMNGRSGSSRGTPVMGDVFSGMGSGFLDSMVDVPGSGTIGTGPGVIHVDNFSPGYSTNMGRLRPQMNQGFQGQWGGNRRQGDREGGTSPKMNRNGNQQQSQFYQKQQSREGGGRDLPPRFMKKLNQNTQGNQQQSSPGTGSAQSGVGPSSSPNTSNSGEISLRPAKNFNTLFKPNTPSMLPKSAQIPHHTYNNQAPRPSSMNQPEHNPLLQKQAQITIKQVPAEGKNKHAKKAAPTKEELQQARESMMEKFMENGNMDEAISAIKEMRAPKKYNPDLICYMMVESLEKSDENREDLGKLFITMKDTGIINSTTFMEGFGSLLDKMAKLEADIPLVKSYAAKFAAHAIVSELATLADVAEQLESGLHYPLFLLTLQQLTRMKDKQWVKTAHDESKIKLIKMLPENDQSKEKMLEILEDRGLSFLTPLLRVQVNLWRQIFEDPNPQTLFKWIKETVDAELMTTTGFIHSLVTNVLRYVMSESSLTDGVDTTVTPDKAIQEKETELLERYKGMLQMFLNERTDLQLQAIYALQVLCYNHGYPKGLLLRMFMKLYDQEVVEEEAFLRWKEELNDEYPGKGKALFQVNQWLTWLEQAEEESEDEEEDDD